MKGIALVLVALASSALVFVEISEAQSRGSSHFGHARPGHSVGTFGKSGFHASFGGYGLHVKSGSRLVHPHRFGHHGHLLHKKFFGPHHHFGRHRIIIHRHGFHGDFFFGHRIFSVTPSSVVIWSHPPITSGHETLWREPTVEREPHQQRPLITFMLRHRKELELSPEQIQGLEQLKHDYQREAIRYEADLRIAEMDLESLLKADPVDLGQVKVKLQETERLKVELGLARIRTIEQGKALLSPEQREKLRALLGEARYSGLSEEGFREPAEDQP